MNPVKLIFKHGGEMLVSPIGLRFVEDPEHGPLVLIPEAQGPKAYQLDMTLRDANFAFEAAHLVHSWQVAINAEIEKLKPRLAAAEQKAEWSRLDSIANLERWEALQIHLGLPEGWEHLNEEAAEVKGALVSQAEEIDKLASRLRSVENHKALQPIFWERLLDTLGYIELSTDEGVHFGLAGGLGLSFEVRKLERQVGELRDSKQGKIHYSDVEGIKKELSLLKEEASLFTLAERVGELEESRRAAFQRLCDAELRLNHLENPEKDTTLPMLGDRVCVQRQSIHPHLPSHWSAAKPKSAWKPLGFLHDGELGRFLVRDSSGGDFSLAFRRRCGEALVFEGRGTSVPSFYEFCPIPE